MPFTLSQNDDNLVILCVEFLDIMKMLQSYRHQQVPENHHITIIRRRSTVHRFDLMPFHTFMIKIHSESIMCWENKTAIYHVKCY